MISKRIRPSLYTYNLLLKCTKECDIGDEFETRKIISQIVNPILFTTESKSEKPINLETDKLNTSLITHEDENQLSFIENRPNLLDVNPYFGNVVDVSNIKTPSER